MKRAKLAAVALLTTCWPLCFALGACGDDDAPNGIEDDAGPSSSGDATHVDATADATPVDNRCATETLGGDLQPLEITLLFDISSSMCFVQHTPDLDAGDGGADDDAGDASVLADAGPLDAGALDAGAPDAGPLDAGGPYDNGHFDCTDARSRWPATTQALKTFLSSAQSAGLTVAVRTFGPVDSWTPPTLAGNRCTAGDYATTDFEATDLPSESFAQRIAAITPNTSHPDATQTQTGAVISGATLYTKGREAALAGTKGVAMVLVTDGDPQGCDPSLPIPNYDTAFDDQLAYDAASVAAAQGLKLYVLNIGGTKAVLDEIAQRGGTEAAITLEDPTNTVAIGEALESIRKKALSCTVNIPTPARGTPDYTKLNVVWTPRGNGGAEQILPQSTDCSNDRGWHYDDPQNPTRIELCADVCHEVTESTQGKLEIELGCQTSTGTN